MSNQDTNTSRHSAPTAATVPPNPPHDSIRIPTDINGYAGADLLPPNDPSLSPAARKIIEMRKRFRPLNEKQFRAIELLVHGHTDAQTAAAIGYKPLAVQRWRLYNPLFRAALSRRRQEIYGSSAERLRISMSKAVKTLRKMLNSDNDSTALRAARAILSLAAYKGFAPPPEPIDPMGIMEQIARQKKIEWHHFDDPRFAALEEIDFLRAMEDLDEHQRNYPLSPDPDPNPSPHASTPHQEEPRRPRPDPDTPAPEPHSKSTNEDPQ